MKTAEIAKRYLDYFEKNGHVIVPSASLVSDDPTLLFTVAGMVPFIPYLSGNVPPPYARAADVQKCIRTNDIEEVGKTPRHGTFFQMLGNWSFGDYFKEGAITFAWDLLTGAEDDGKLGFDPKDLWVTVYEDDDEAMELWKRIAGLPEERIQRLGKDSNYWSTGRARAGRALLRDLLRPRTRPTASTAARPRMTTATSRSGTSSSCSTRSTTCARRSTSTSWASCRTRTSTPAWGSSASRSSSRASTTCTRPIRCVPCSTARSRSRARPTARTTRTTSASA